MAKNLPYNAGDASLIPGLGTKIPNATGKLSLCALEPMHPKERSHVPQLRPEAAKIKFIKKKKKKRKEMCVKSKRLG